MSQLTLSYDTYIIVDISNPSKKLKHRRTVSKKKTMQNKNITTQSNNKITQRNENVPAPHTNPIAAPTNNNMYDLNHSFELNHP